MTTISKIQFDILNNIHENHNIIKEELSARLFRSEEEISGNYKKLQNDDFIDTAGLTNKGRNYLENHRINNAIILAAGMSTRFVPFN